MFEARKQIMLCARGLCYKCAHEDEGICSDILDKCDRNLAAMELELRSYKELKDEKFMNKPE